jgi:nucleoside 2-deoxyribosyltransferase
MKPRVFISSTCYDLIDVRAELEAKLREMHLEPVLSASPVSPMAPLPDANSIETCLAHVRSSDYVIVILNQRYGSSLKPVGYDDVSATHLEYREAMATKKPTFFLVRDRLEADFSTWKKNKGRVDALPWVDGNDFGLFQFLKERRSFRKGQHKSNWYETFRDSVELKGLVASYLREPASVAELDRAIQNNAVPALAIDTDIEELPFGISLKCTMKNVGGAAAFNVELIALSDVVGGIRSTIPVIPSLHSTHKCIVLPPGIIGSLDVPMELRYQTPSGHHVRDEFYLGFEKFRDGSTLFGCTFLARTFRIASSDDRPYTIERDE